MNAALLLLVVLAARPVVPPAAVGFVVCLVGPAVLAYRAERPADYRMLPRSARFDLVAGGFQGFEDVAGDFGAGRFVPVGVRQAIHDRGDCGAWPRFADSRGYGCGTAVRAWRRGYVVARPAGQGCDGEDADLGLVGEALFDPATGQLATGLEELIEPAGDRLLILGSVRLVPQWRGFGVGVLLAGTAIKKLSGGVRLAACYPAPLGEPGDAGGEEDEDPAGRGVAVATLSEVWGQLGFEHFRGGVHVLDLNLVTLDESLERLRKQVGQQRSWLSPTPSSGHGVPGSRPAIGDDDG